MAGFYDSSFIQPSDSTSMFSTNSPPKLKSMKKAKATSRTLPPLDDRGFPSPTLGVARTASSTSPMQEWQVPIGPVEHPGEFQPPPIGAAWEGFTGGSGGGRGPGLGGFDTSVMPSVANAQLSNFFGRNIGELAGQGIDQAVGDESLGRQMWQQEHLSGLAGQRLSHQILSKQLEMMPQEQKMRLLEVLPGLQYMMQTPVQGPDGQFHMQTDPRMRQALSGALEPFLPTTTTSTSTAVSGGGSGGETGFPSQPTGSRSQATDATPTASFGRSALHSLLPSLAGAGGWAGAAALAPETGFMSFAIPALASLGLGFGANKLMNKVDPGFAQTRPNTLGEGAGALAGLVGGYKGMKALRPGIKPLTAAEQELESPTSGAPQVQQGPTPTGTPTTGEQPFTIKSMFGEPIRQGASRVSLGGQPQPNPAARPMGFGAGGPILSPQSFPQRTGGFGASGSIMAPQAEAPVQLPQTQPQPQPLMTPREAVAGQTITPAPTAPPPPPNATAAQLYLLGFSPEQVQAILANQQMGGGGGGVGMSYSH